MVHHIQNLEGRLQNIQTTNTNEDSNLLEIEAEAYMQGNITFRNWEDSLKNQNESLWANINKNRVISIHGVLFYNDFGVALQPFSLSLY